MEQSSELLPILFFLVFGAVMLALTAFWIWMLVDCVKYESSEGNDKLIWILVILLAGWIGALVYFFVRRSPRLS